MRALFVGLCLLAATTTKARAETDTTARVNVLWSAPVRACPSPESVRNDIKRRVGRRVDQRVTTSAAIEVTIAARRDTGGTWTADVRVTLNGQTASRTISGPSCRDLARAAALVAALAAASTAEISTVLKK